jgi:hypothetical protein
VIIAAPQRYAQFLLENLTATPRTATWIDAVTKLQQVVITVTDSVTLKDDYNYLVICENTSPITITMPVGTYRVGVVRSKSGAVTLDGDGTDIIGNPTLSLASQYDVVNLIRNSDEWVMSS